MIKNRSECSLKSEAGFTIIETVLAIGVLAAAIASIVSLQASVVAVTSLASHHTQARWTLNSAFSQAEYLREVKGQDFFPEDSQFTWKGATDYNVDVKRKDLTKLKTSDFVKTALNIFFKTDPNSDDEKNVDQMVGVIAPFIDNPGTTNTLLQNLSGGASQPQAGRDATPNPQAPQKKSAVGPYVNLEFLVSWKNGTTTKTWKNTLLIMNQKTLADITLPNLNSPTKKNP